MDLLIWSGASLSLMGLAGLMLCIFQVWKARRSGLDDEALRAAVARVVPWNMAALGLSVIGLMLVILGIFLGGS